MAPLLELRDDVLANLWIDEQAAQVRAALPKRPEQVVGAKAGRRHRILRREPKINEVQKHLQRGLVLAVAAGHADRDDRLAVLEDQRGRQGDAWAFAGLDAVRQAFPGVEALQP